MQLMKDILKNKKVLISGQVYTSRTETLEEYLKDKVKILGVIGIAGAFQNKNFARCTLYKDAQRIKEFKLPSILIKKYNRFSKILLIPVFALYFFSILLSAFRLRQKFDLFIGISHFSGFMGIILKKLGFVKNTIYYCLDYYAPSEGFGFDSLGVRIEGFLDRLTARNVDFVWNISLRVMESREIAKKVSSNRDKQIVVPLCYNTNFLCPRPFKEIERWTVGFVGALSTHHGLEMVFKALPKIVLEIPKIKMKIIGSGLLESKLKELVSQLKLYDKVTFYGHLEAREMNEILSCCALGIAPWVLKKNSYFLYGDPGKIKLYAFCGLPIIMTKGSPVAEEIEKMKAGIVINYNVEEFVDAVVRVLRNEKLLKEYRNNALKFASKYTSENIFQPAFEKAFNHIPSLRKHERIDDSGYDTN